MSAPVFGRVLYNYAASHYDELSIRFNQIVTVVSENTGADGWWEVQLQGKKGKVPANYIEVIPEPRGTRTADSAVLVNRVCMLIAHSLARSLACLQANAHNACTITRSRRSLASIFRSSVAT